MSSPPNVKYSNKKKKKYCNNCNTNGHNYKECTHPITSHGIICYRVVNDIIEYLIIRRRFSFSYADFIRTLKPRQSNEDIDYICILLSRMTPIEHNMLKNNEFDFLWNDLWLDNTYKHLKDYKKCRKIYNLLVDGKTNSGKSFSTLKDLLETSKSKFEEAEWGFPKGKRNANETDEACASREFTEESGLDYNLLKIHKEVLPMYEEYKSINNKNYRSIYYLAKYEGPDFDMSIDQNNKEQYCEVDKIEWAPLSECKEKFRYYYTSKYDLLQNIDCNLQNKFKLNEQKTVFTYKDALS
jgi:ADP-ribose pyrophosphatase YjhB (NUDIX family)